MDTGIILTMKINFENFDLMALLAWRVTYYYLFIPVQIMVLNTPQKRNFSQFSYIKPAPKDSRFEQTHNCQL